MNSQTISQFTSNHSSYINSLFEAHTMGTRYCEVSGCRYPNSHTTRSHHCGTCGEYGHGQLECNSNVAKQQLRKFFNDTLPLYLQCTQPLCEFKQFHTSRAHFCSICNGNHASCNCADSNDYRFRAYRELKSLNTSPNFTNKIICKIECPTCRQVNTFNLEYCVLYGVEAKCSICFDNDINTRIPCGHTLCSSCVLQLNKYIEPVPLNPYIPQQTNQINSTFTHADLNNFFLARFAGVDGKVCHSINTTDTGYWILRRDKVGEFVQSMFIYQDNIKFAVASIIFKRGYREI